MNIWIVQGIGICAYILLVLMYQAKTKTQMLVMQFIMQITFCLHYFLLGPVAYVGAFISIVAMIRAFVFANRDSWAKSKLWLGLFIFVFSAVTVLNWQTSADFFSLFGIIISTTALWVKDMKVVRRLFIVSSFFWFLYNACVGSYAGIVGEVIGVTSNMIAMCRYDIDLNKYKKIFLFAHK